MRIFAIGGGGFTSATCPGLDDVLLSLIETTEKRIGYIGTASANDPVRVGHFLRLIAPRASYASIMPDSVNAREAAAWVGRHDLIFVGGGDTAQLLTRWRAVGLPDALRAAGNDGIVLAGVSAGAACWFERALVRRRSGVLEPIDGLGFLPGSVCAHYSSENDRRPAFEALIAEDALPAGIGIDDGVGVLQEGSGDFAAWSDSDGSWAYRVRRDLPGGVDRLRLPAFVKG